MRNQANTVRTRRDLADEELSDRRDAFWFFMGVALTLTFQFMLLCTLEANDLEDWHICQKHARYHKVPIAEYCPTLAKKYWRSAD